MRNGERRISPGRPIPDLIAPLSGWAGRGSARQAWWRDAVPSTILATLITFSYVLEDGGEAWVVVISWVLVAAVLLWDYLHRENAQQ